MGMEKEFLAEIMRLTDVTHDLHCSVQVMREALLASFDAVPGPQRQALAANIRNRVEGLLSHADDMEGAQLTRERMALEAHLLTQPLLE